MVSPFHPSGDPQLVEDVLARLEMLKYLRLSQPVGEFENDRGGYPVRASPGG